MNKPQVARVRDLINAAPLRQYIGEEGAQVLAERAASETRLANDDFLYHQGDTASSFYIVAEGRIAFVQQNSKDDKPRILHVLEKGDLLGELSFIDGSPRECSAVALGEASVLCFEAADIIPLSTEHPKLIFDFMRAVIKRVHHTLSSMGQQQRELADYIASGGRGRR
jgi:CRP-like cAMP-binding protein